MDLNTAARELYAAPYEGFTTARATLVKQAKQDGDADLATELGHLRKPTRSAWLVNLVARAEADQIGALLDLGAALAEAHHSLSMDELRALSAQRSKVVDGLTRQAIALGADHGHQASDAVRQEVSATLEAALADPAVGEAVRAGTLTKAATWSGFGPAAPPATDDAAPPSGTKLAEVVNLADRRRSQARTRASAAMGEARRGLADAAHRVDREQAAADRSARAVAEGEQLVNHLTTTLAAAKKDLQKANRLHTEANQAQQRAEQQRSRAEQTVTEAEQKLADLREDH